MLIFYAYFPRLRKQLYDIELIGAIVIKYTPCMGVGVSVSVLTEPCARRRSDVTMFGD